MNRIYKVVWSRARQCYVVASELAHRSGKKSAAVLAVAACTMSIWGGIRSLQRIPVWKWVRTPSPRVTVLSRPAVTPLLLVKAPSRPATT